VLFLRQHCFFLWQHCFCSSFVFAAMLFLWQHCFWGRTVCAAVLFLRQHCFCSSASLASVCGSTVCAFAVMFDYVLLPQAPTCRVPRLL
jgi:hypothetical protein